MIIPIITLIENIKVLMNVVSAANAGGAIIPWYDSHKLDRYLLAPFISVEVTEEPITTFVFISVQSISNVGGK